MSNLSKLEFVTLNIFGKNYISWVFDVEIHLTAKGLGDSIIKGNKASNQDKAKAMIFLHHHLDESLKAEYLTVKDPLELWIGLKGRYEHLKAAVLSRAHYEWMHLWFQDYKTVIEYNSVVFRSTFQLKLCGKTIYSELVSCLLVAEHHNDLLMRNHEACSTGIAPLPEANKLETHGQSEIRQDNRGHDNLHKREKGKK
ncbi:uncharacterized protein LOC125855889 [Solanum stenotomum]|uniref:uncharacterized protein LOC125855889 n=1 Tax=Solanum stenotomum TaxID=172797 RepID=UPI0020D14BFB|nr:uncharacterized protein LOC125855889 [Solanum stenotomum]